jgi:hypothetical protein
MEILLILVAALVILDILAYYFGVDSRDGFNPPPSPDDVQSNAGDG